MRTAKDRYVKVADRLLDHEEVETTEGIVSYTVADVGGGEYYVLRCYKAYGWLPRRNIMTHDELIADLPERLAARMDDIRDELMGEASYHVPTS